MTLLQIQNLRIPECEAALERAYFDWGRGWSKDSPEPDWDAASADERRTIALRGYALYDGCPVPTDDLVTSLDTYVSIGISSRMTLFDTVRFVARADRASELLADIPADAELESATDKQITAVASLIDLFGEARYVGRGKATKVLHKKRPALIPILDSVASDFLWKNFPHVLTQGSPTKQVLDLCKSLLVSRMRPLSQIQANLAAGGLWLSKVRILDFLIWIRWNGGVDESGFGRPFVKVWGVNCAQARVLARKKWEDQR